MKIKKILKSLAISLLLRYEVVRWVAWVILTALSPVRKEKPLEESAVSGITSWLYWLERAKEGKESYDPWHVIVTKCKLGMTLMVRGP